MISHSKADCPALAADLQLLHNNNNNNNNNNRQ